LGRVLAKARSSAARSVGVRARGPAAARAGAGSEVMAARKRDAAVTPATRTCRRPLLDGASGSEEGVWGDEDAAAAVGGTCRGRDRGDAKGAV
jgi:hypothetical protein